MRARHTVFIQTLPVHNTVKILHDPRSKAHFEALEQTRRLRLEGPGDNYFFLSVSYHTSLQYSIE